MQSATSHEPLAGRRIRKLPYSPPESRRLEYSGGAPVEIAPVGFSCQPASRLPIMASDKAPEPGEYGLLRCCVPHCASFQPHSPPGGCGCPAVARPLRREGHYTLISLQILVPGVLDDNVLEPCGLEKGARFGRRNQISPTPIVRPWNGMVEIAGRPQAMFRQRKMRPRLQDPIGLARITRAEWPSPGADRR